MCTEGKSADAVWGRFSQFLVGGPGSGIEDRGIQAGSSSACTNKNIPTKASSHRRITFQTQAGLESRSCQVLSFEASISFLVPHSTE